ncbi:MAG: DUF1015 family protein [Nitriliruptoraceae bacterium]
MSSQGNGVSPFRRHAIPDIDVDDVRLWCAAGPSAPSASLAALIADVLDAEDRAGAEAGGVALRRLDEAITTGLLPVEHHGAVVHEMVDADRTVRGVVATISTSLADDRRLVPHEQTRQERECQLVQFQSACRYDVAPVLVAHAPSAALQTAVEQLAAGPPDLVAVIDEVTHRWWFPSDAERTPLRSAVATVGRLTVMDGHHRLAAARRRAAGLRTPVPLFAELVDEAALGMAAFDVIVDIEDPSGVRRSLDDVGKMTELAGVTKVSRPIAEEILVRLSRRWYSLVLEPAPNDGLTAQSVALPPSALLYERVLGPVFGVHDARSDRRLMSVPGRGDLGHIAAIADGATSSRCHDPDGHQPQDASRVAFVTRSPHVAEIADAARNGILMPPKSTFALPKPPPGLIVHERR